MRKSINVPPPRNFENYTPSELFRFFFQLGHWTDDSLSDALQSFTGGKLVSTVTISKWKNKNVIPARYSGPILNLIKDSVTAELADDWQTAFETVWAQYSVGRKPCPRTAENTGKSDAICDQHKKWVRQLYNQTVPGQTYSASDIYVPLKLYDVNQDSPRPLDLKSFVTKRMQSSAERLNSNWMFVSGTPGSGKSITALHLAQALCDEDIFLIYIRCSQLSDIEIDIVNPDQAIVDSFSVSSFLKHFRASSFESACLILDGLDNIRHNNHKSSDGLNRLLSNLRIEQSVCTAHQKSLCIVGLGRDSHVEHAATRLGASEYTHLAMLPMDGRFTELGEEDGCLGTDLRPDWWRNYLAINNRSDDKNLPDFLCVQYDDFSEFGTVPALAYLLCKAAFAEAKNAPVSALPHEIVNTFTYTSNKNEIYKVIVERFVEGEKRDLDKKGGLSALQKLAVAIWHTPEDWNEMSGIVFDQAKDQEINAALKALNPDSQTPFAPPDLLISATHYRPSPSETSNPIDAVDFLHQSIAEYVICTAVFECFQRLILSFNEREAFELAVKSWIDLSCNGSHQPGLAGFCQREAALRYEALVEFKWDAALTIIKEHLNVRVFDGSGVKGLAQVQRAYSLLFFIWSCLNLERQKRTGSHFKLPCDSTSFHAGDLKFIKQANGLDLETGTLLEHRPRQQTFLTSSLSALHFTSADMSQLNFSLGHMEHPIFEDSSFAMTHWSHVKINQGHFDRSSFQQAMFHQLQLLKTQFSNCLIQGSRFQGGVFSDCEFRDSYFSQCHFADVEFINSYFENVIFDRCIFSQSAFARIEQEKTLQSVTFRHCTFLDMEKVMSSIPAVCFENSIR